MYRILPLLTQQDIDDFANVKRWFLAMSARPAVQRAKQVGMEAVQPATQEMLQGDRPSGLEGARRFLMLMDRESGRGLGLTFFDTVEDRRRGDEALGSMSPQTHGGRRTSVEMYEVAIDEQF